MYDMFVICGSCHQVMFDTVGPELQVINKAEQPINLEAEAFVMLTPDATQQSSSTVLPHNYPELANVSYSVNIVFLSHTDKIKCSR